MNFAFCISLSARAQEKTEIVHFGDSTCITSYLSKDQRVDHLLNAKLKQKYKDEKISSDNVAEDGDSIHKFLDGRYKKDVRDKFKHIDIALIRYGQNDMKKIKPDEFKKDLEALCDRIEADYPGVHIILETNTFVDPAHGGSEWMNKQYALYWDVSRKVAEERKYPLVDIFAMRKKEVEAGRWDLCIRNQKLSKEKFDHLIVDDSKDKEMEGVENWFGDSHPNPHAVELNAEEEFGVISKTWPDKLPGEKK